jgi:hypothetical protein
MPDTKLQDLTAASDPVDTDLVYIVRDPSGTPLDKKIEWGTLRDVKSYTTVENMVTASALGTTEAIIVQAQATAGDGGWGVFVWDSTVPATTYNDDSSKLIFAYTDGKSTDGCWRRILGGVIGDVSIPIGASERFTTLNSAIDAVETLKSINGTTITLELETGFTVAEQVIVTNGEDLSNIKITSVDAQVTVDRSTITTTTGSLDGFQGLGTWIGVFMAGNGSTLPRIGTIFAFDAGGAANWQRSGIFITNGSKCIVEPNCGIHDTDGSGAFVRYSSTLIASESSWDNNGTDAASTANELCGIRAEFQSIVSAQECSVTNSNEHGIQILGASIASLRNATVTSAAGVGIYGGGCSVIHARGVNVTLCGTGMYAYEGCTVRLLSSTLDSNTGNGLWIDNGATVNSATGTSISSNGANGVRITTGGRFIIVTPTISSNTNDGIDCANGDAFVSAGTIANNSDTDLTVTGANAFIRISGTLTTTAGNTAANNLTDSNVAAFNCPTVSGSGGIYGRGGDAGNRGTATVANGTTSIAVTHNVDFTPLIQEVQVTATNDLGSAAKFWVTNMTTTQFTINTDVDPGAGGATFGWAVQRMHG